MTYTPRESAENFSNLLHYLKPGPDVSNIVRVSVEGGDVEQLLSRNREYVGKLSERTEELLSHAPITPAYRTHIIDNLLRGYRTGIGYPIDIGLQTCGVYLDREIYGIFDPQLATEIERFALQERVEDFYSSQSMLAPDDYTKLAKDFTNFAGWFRRKFGIGPDPVTSEAELTEEFNVALDKIRKRTNPQYEELQVWMAEFKELHGDDPFSKEEGQNPFYL